MEETPTTVIMHKGEVFNGLIFTSVKQARNYLKWKFPNKNWKEPEKNTLVCFWYGTKFQIIGLTPYLTE